MSETSFLGRVNENSANRHRFSVLGGIFYLCPMEHYASWDNAMTVKILHGDCIKVMKKLPADSVDCVVTSPPYWGLRDYGVDGQMGLENSLGKHIDVMLKVFREVKRILKPTGTLWVNYGDCYATTPNGRKAEDIVDDDRAFRDKPFSTIGPINKGRRMERGSGRWGGGNNPAGGVLKPKDLCMIPNRLAIALQEDGWWVRSEIIWAKPNAMPDSGGIGRPSTAHEKIWLLSKSGDTTCYRARDNGQWSFSRPDLSERLPVPRGKCEDTPRWRGFDFYYNADEVRVGCSENTHARLSQDVMNQIGSARANGGKKTNGNMKAVKPSPKTAAAGVRVKNNPSFHEAMAIPVMERFLRNYEPAPVQVWEIPTEAFSEAHFATFPQELAARCIKAGCPKGGTVFDPFGGAGTTGLVAANMGLDAILVELNPEYIDIARDRIRAGLHRVDCKQKEGSRDIGPLFMGAS
jgi:DNA modification methylase